MISIRQYLFSVSNSHGLTRTLGEIDVCRDAEGRMCYTAGNSAVVFKIRHKGQVCSLRCYTRATRNLAAIYGERLLPAELFIYSDGTSGEWVDVVLGEWIEGDTLHERIARADSAEFARLAESFDTLAATIIADECAHGDLKPENIIVRADGTLQLIDLDASFLPAFTGLRSPELGTAAFQHPSRTAFDFDAHLDDFPAALIATSLCALALDPTLRDRYGVHDTLLIDPQRLKRDAALHEIFELFEQHGMAAHYRIARLLFAPTHRLHGLADLFGYAVQGTRNALQEEPELFADRGLWGYRGTTTGHTLIPPLYDCGFDFTEELAAVQLGCRWHYINPQGRNIIPCGEFDAVKPFRNGRGRALRSGQWYEIDHTGQVYVLEY